MDRMVEIVGARQVEDGDDYRLSGDLPDSFDRASLDRAQCRLGFLAPYSVEVLVRHVLWLGDVRLQHEKHRESPFWLYEPQICSAKPGLPEALAYRSRQSVSSAIVHRHSLR